MTLAESYLKGNKLQHIYSELHRLFLTAKLSHYKTKSLAGHEAFGKIYDALSPLIDEIVEQLVGYSKVDPEKLEVGSVSATGVSSLGAEIISFSDMLCKYADEKKYRGVCNLADELSGLGAKLQYLSRFP